MVKMDRKSYKKVYLKTAIIYFSHEPYIRVVVICARHIFWHKTLDNGYFSHFMP
jgi:hypothetical protein